MPGVAKTHSYAWYWRKTLLEKDRREDHVKDGRLQASYRENWRQGCVSGWS